VLSGTTSDVEHLVWPAACLIAFIEFIIAFRKSISNLLSRRLNKLWGVEFGEQSTQQQKELEIRPERTGLENQPQPADPRPRLRFSDRSLINLQKNQSRGKRCCFGAWQSGNSTTRNARTMRLIFGSQLELLDELNAKQPQGESIDALKKHYDSGGAKIWGDVSGFPL